MTILALDSSGSTAGVAITCLGQLKYESILLSHKEHSIHLLPMIEEALCRSGTKKDTLSRIACVIGPGSFTGIRLSVSCAKAMAQTLQIPCVPINALEALVCVPFHGLICPMIDARAQRVYCSLYSSRTQIRDDDTIRVEDMAREIATLKENCFFVGSGAVAYRPIIEDLLPGKSFFAPEHMNYLRPSEAAFLAEKKLNSIVSYEHLNPYYLHAPHYKRESLPYHAVK